MERSTTCRRPLTWTSRSGIRSEIVVDRLVVGDSAETGRVTDSVETAVKMADGVVLVSILDGDEMLFSEEFACVHCNISLGEMEPRTFSFNNPHGACPTCTGIGYRLEVDPNLVIPNKDLSIAEGAVQPWTRAGSSSPWLLSLLASVAEAHRFSTTVPVKKLTKKQLDIVLYGNKGKRITMRHNTQKGKTYEWDTTFEGVVNNLERRYRSTESDYIRSEIERYMMSRPCHSCEGQRLKPEALAVKVCGLNVMEVTAKSISQAQDWIDSISGASSVSHISGVTDSTNGAFANAPTDAGEGQRLTERETTIASQILKEIDARLRFLLNIGLDYLTLSRTAGTLSGGEAQRIRLATQIGSGLMGVLYVCDEPSIGLHPADDHRLITTLQGLRDLGNTVIIVEHDEAIMRAADHIVDLGPGAGEHGGHIVATGTVSDIIGTSESLTGQYLGHFKSIPMPESRRRGNGKRITIKGARENNLKEVDVEIPLGRLVCVTGVSGSGKSTLIYEVLYKKLAQHFYKAKDRPGAVKAINGVEKIDKVVNIDQSPIGRTPRSNPATYTGTFTPIRELFATIPEGPDAWIQARPVLVQREGWTVRGVLRRRLHQHRDAVPARRDRTLRGLRGQAVQPGGDGDRVQGRNIAEVLNMTVTEALDFFVNIPRVRNKLQTMHDVGLGYIRLGQPATQLSGGEAQRVKLSTELSKRATGQTLYILDEPTTGLSFEDCSHLLGVLHRLVETGNSVVLIEHHLDMIKNADWIIDLGPGAGDKGGYVIAEGTPEQMAELEHSLHRPVPSRPPGPG